MTQPTEEYLEMDKQVREILDRVDLGGLEVQFLGNILPVEPGFKTIGELPDVAAFSLDGRVMGVLEFFPYIDVISLEREFIPYAVRLRRAINKMIGNYSEGELSAVKPYFHETVSKLPNVTGTGIREKEQDGRILDYLCLRAYVEQKLPPERLKHEELVPSPFEYEGKLYPTDVREIGGAELS